jgi:hypothetical protein
VSDALPVAGLAPNASAEPTTDATPFDGLLNRLDDLAERPVAEHHDRLAEVHEALHSALHEPPVTT